MSDPRETPNPPPAPPPPPPPGNEPPVVEERRKGVHPLVWILVLLALAALAWWFYNRSVGTGLDTTAPVTGAEPAVTSEQEQAANAERERAAANERRQAERRRERAAAGDTAVEPIERVQPDYPPAAYRAREEGTVLLRVNVDASGNPTEVSVARRSGSRDLDRAAQQAVRKWKFRPATKGGQAVASVAQVPVDFRMDR